MLYELLYILKVLEKVDNTMGRDIFAQHEISRHETEIDDFHELEDYIQRYLASLKNEPHDEMAKIRAYCIRMHITLGSCANNIELVQDLAKKLRRYLSDKNKKISDA